uniref:uncharacterized protein LOC108950550 isoform X3 n=1 Tax=Ciona intestinalis TaxID=7719 RepID=UPI000EF48B7C|nr:uncharacterized protein LOC108950550 isoform X3 [Ciona intestinalis]|eukprot:XP_026695209.1 uncharacterized protein LOC108950550 isoform X3 [Ciona intestinalis]
MRILKGKKRISFTHLTWQEFYAAVHLMLFMPQEEFRRCMNTFKDPHWEVVTRFLFGICNSTSYKDLEVIFPAWMIKDYKDKKDILKSLIALESEHYMDKDVIRMSGWVHEANDSEIYQKFEERMPQLIRMKAPSNRTEIAEVAFAFNTFTTPRELNLSKCGSDEASFVAFLRGLRVSQITRLNIENVRMTDSTTQALLPHLGVLDQLDLDERKLAARNRIILHEAVERLTNPKGLKVNDMSGDRWSKYWKVFKDQPDDDVMQILQLLPGKIKGLNIWGVRMTDSMTQALLPHLDVMDKLGLVYRFYDMNLNLYMEDISRKIMDRQHKIQIWVEDYAVEHVRPLFQCLDKISKLCLEWRYLSWGDWCLLKEAMQRLHSPQDFVLEANANTSEDEYEYKEAYFALRIKFWQQ